MNSRRPYLIEFPKLGGAPLGYISVAEHENLPFVPHRVYWTYFTPENVVRGGHSHFELEQILVAVSGKVILEIETAAAEKFEFVLDAPNKGVFIPKLSWRTMKYTHNAVQMCLASQEYDEQDYIRDYEIFQSHQKK